MTVSSLLRRIAAAETTKDLIDVEYDARSLNVSERMYDLVDRRFTTKWNLLVDAR